MYWLVISLDAQNIIRKSQWVSMMAVFSWKYVNIEVVLRNYADKTKKDSLSRFVEEEEKDEEKRAK